MDQEEKRKRIKALAQSLRALHVVGSDEEAEDRARKMVEDFESADSNIKDIMGGANTAEQSLSDAVKQEQETAEELRAEVDQMKDEIDQNIEEVKDIKEDLQEAKDTLKEDVEIHNLEQGQVEEATEKLDSIECAAEDAETIVEEADKVQEE